MSSDYKHVYCPLMGHEIDYYDTCVDICMVAEGNGAGIDLPDGFELTEEGQRFCMTCKEHPDLD